MLPLILSNCEKIFHIRNVTTYQQMLYPDGHFINSKSRKVHVVERKRQEFFLREIL